MEGYLLKSVTIVDPSGPNDGRTTDVCIRGGRIEDIGDISSKEGAKTIDAQGTYLSPGWMDMEVHLSDPGFEYKERLDDLAKAAQLGGFTRILCYPNTLPVVDNGAMIQALTQRSEHFVTKIHFAGALSEAAHGKDLAEVFDMHQAGALAFTDGTHPIDDAGLLLRALQYFKSFDGLIINQPLSPKIAGEGQMNEGHMSTKLGMKGIPEIAELVAVDRDLRLLSYQIGRYHFHPVTSSEALERIAEQNFSEVTTGTSLPYLILDDTAIESYDSNYKVMPPIRDKSQQISLLESLKNGQLNVLTSGHRPQGVEEKKVEFEQAEPGMLGLQSFFGLANMHLVQTGHISLSRLIELIAHQPRKILKLDIPHVAKGNEAELTWFSTDKSWEYSPAQVPSRAKNSPFFKQNLKGKPLGIFQKGRFLQDE
ncbi:dihydroorotase [Pontibacter sp. G13]|uniref:dihydroorotase n=1 Tax=Pontibacter sp. G13 TaxID=3074898 RepID=UPI00288C0387|nr:dihydroorotase [Pontibacter sp. G13]WNJ18842.1 dihydroorotase [Pontibacter sp. G13]